MKNALKIMLILFVSFTSAYADMAGSLQKVHEFVQDDIVKAVATILFIVAGFMLASGKWQEGKGYLWGIVIGISLVYGAPEIVNAVF